MANLDCPFNVNDDCCFDDEVVVDKEEETIIEEINMKYRDENKSCKLNPYKNISPVSNSTVGY